MRHFKRTIQRMKPRIRTQSNGRAVRATVVMPNRQRYTAMVRYGSPEILAGELDSLCASGLAGDELAGKFWRKLKKRAVKIGKGGYKAIGKVRKVMNNPVVVSIERAVTGTLAVAFPVLAPAVAAREALRAGLNKLADAKNKTKFAVDAIKKATEHLPPKARKVVQVAVATRMKNRSELKNIAKLAVKEKVKRALASGAIPRNVDSRKLLKAASVGRPYIVKLPSGRTVVVPASKVA